MEFTHDKGNSLLPSCKALHHPKMDLPGKDPACQDREGCKNQTGRDRANLKRGIKVIKPRIRWSLAKDQQAKLIECRKR